MLYQCLLLAMIAVLAMGEGEGENVEYPRLDRLDSGRYKRRYKKWRDSNRGRGGYGAQTVSGWDRNGSGGWRTSKDADYGNNGNNEGWTKYRYSSSSSSWSSSKSSSSGWRKKEKERNGSKTWKNSKDAKDENVANGGYGGNEGGWARSGYSGEYDNNANGRNSGYKRSKSSSFSSSSRRRRRSSSSSFSSSDSSSSRYRKRRNSRSGTWGNSENQSYDGFAGNEGGYQESKRYKKSGSKKWRTSKDGGLNEGYAGKRGGYKDSKVSKRFKKSMGFAGNKGENQWKDSKKRRKSKDANY